MAKKKVTTKKALTRKRAVAKKAQSKPAEKRPVGRPTDYKPEYCQRVIELGRLGKSKAQIAANLDVARQTMEDWARAHPEFLDAITRARDLALAWWEDQAQVGLVTEPGTGTFNASLWSKSVSCRFPDDYRDNSRHEVTGKDGEAVAVQVYIPDNGRGNGT